MTVSIGPSLCSVSEWSVSVAATVVGMLAFRLVMQSRCETSDSFMCGVFVLTTRSVSVNCLVSELSCSRYWYPASLHSACIEQKSEIKPIQYMSCVASKTKIFILKHNYLLNYNKDRIFSWQWW